jgi:hypothetical protein
MLRLMSQRLRAANRHEYVRMMLGAQDVVARVVILRGKTYRGRHGAWTRVVARLDFDHGTVTDWLAVIHTPLGDRINSIRERSETT